MKKQKIKIFTLSAIAYLLLFSCNSEELINEEAGLNEPYVSENGKFRLTEDEAVTNLQAFLVEFDQPTEESVSTRSNPTRVIENIQAIGQNKQEVNTHNLCLRSSSANTDTDTLFYLINFKDAGGFAIVSADKRSNKVYAIIDEGGLDVNDLHKVTNTGFIMYMENAILSELNTINKYDATYDNKSVMKEKPELRYSLTEYPKIKPLLKTKWGQGYPYGEFCPNGLTGCVPTALAQIMSHIKTINKASYYSDDYVYQYTMYLIWDRIISDGENNRPYGTLNKTDNYQSSLEVAFLMRNIGDIVVANYNSDVETTANSGVALTNMYKSGFFRKNYRYEDFDALKAYKALAKKNLVYMDGVYGNMGHTWVIDGAYSVIGGGGTWIAFYMHCNWGWDGLYDGYYHNFLGNEIPEKESIDGYWAISTPYTQLGMSIID